MSVTAMSTYLLHAVPVSPAFPCCGDFATDRSWNVTEQLVWLKPQPIFLLFSMQMKDNGSPQTEACRIRYSLPKVCFSDSPVAKVVKNCRVCEKNGTK